MRKLIFTILLLLIFGTNSFAQIPFPGWGIASGNNSGGATDYTVDANCMGAWYMNGGLSANGDNETDRSGEGGTLIETSGDIPNNSTVPSGYSGTSRVFVASDTESFVCTTAACGSLEITGADQSVSVCAWIKSVTDTGLWATIAGRFCDGTLSGCAKQYCINIDEGGADVAAFTVSWNGTASNSATGTTDVVDGQWHHICGVYNDTDIRLYVDGSLDENGSDNPKAYTDGIYNGAQSTNTDFMVGDTENRDWYFDGYIDEIIVFDRALSSGEVSEIYTNGISGNKGGND